MKPLRRGCVCFEETLCQTRFLRTMSFCDGRDLLVASGYDAGTIGALKPWQLLQKLVLRARASHETELSSTLRSRCGTAPIFGISVLPQNSMAGAAFCETAVLFSWRAQHVVQWCYPIDQVRQKTAEPQND